MWHLGLASRGMWDLSSLTRDGTRVPCIVRRILYHWTTGEVPTPLLFFFFFFINLFFIYLFIFYCVGSSFLCEGFLQLWQAGATLHRGARASHCCGLLLWSTAPDAQAQQLWRTGLVAPRHMGSSQTRAQTRVPCISRQTLNHCATREALHCFLKCSLKGLCTRTPNPCDCEFSLQG